MKQIQLPYEVFQKAIANNIPLTIRRINRTRVIRKVFIIAFLALLATMLLTSCTEQSKCVQCTTTETTSHGIVHGTTVTLEVCGDDEIKRYYTDNNKITREAQWIGPGVTDSMIVEIERRTECGGYTYSN